MVYEVAKIVIDESNKIGIDITNLRLNKLLYFSQAQSYITFGTPLFEDDMEAWDLGPVSRKVYARFYYKGSTPIVADDIRDVPETARLTEEQENVIRQVVRELKDFNDFGLVALTHHQDPWKNHYKKGEFGTTIPNESIKKYFSKKC